MGLRALAADDSTSRRAAQFESDLGDPHDQAGPLNYKLQVEYDEDSKLPLQALSLMTKLEHPALIVPAAFGGNLDRPEDILWTGRMMARRDMTVALTFGSTLLAAMPVWLWGTSDQRDRVARAVLGGALGGFGISEADHGSDLQASDTTLLRGNDDVLIRGTKWPIGNATRGKFLTVLAKSLEPGGDGFSLLCLFKEDLPIEGWANTPAVRLLGLRGFDLSGISFQDCAVTSSAQVGQANDGLKQTMKTLQVTRTMLTAFSLGSGDTALRLALDHTRRRTLYGATAYDIPIIRRQLVGCYLDLLIAECVARPAFRALSVRPGQLSLWSSVSKFLAPTLVEEVMADIGEVLGARKFMREGVWHGIFQKLLRDHSVVSVFDGTTHVCLRTIAAQLPAVLARPSADVKQATGSMMELFSFASTAPTWEPDGDRLQLINRGRDEVSQNWRASLSILRTEPTGATNEMLSAITALCQDVDREWDALRERMARLRAKNPNFVVGPTGHDEAQMFCLLYAASACLQTWLVNREKSDAEFGEGGWLLGCLQRLLHRIRPFDYMHGSEAEDGMLRRFDERFMFSLELVRITG